MARRRVGGKATRPDDGRIKANLPPERRAKERPKTRHQQLLDGDINPWDLDDEEIRLGRVRNKAGNFSGRPPAMLPRKLSDAMRNEFMRRTQQKFEETVDIGHETLREIAQNRRASAPARVAAAIHLIERGAGKVPDKVQSTVELKPFQEAVESLLVDGDELAQRRAERENRKTG